MRTPQVHASTAIGQPAILKWTTRYRDRSGVMPRWRMPSWPARGAILQRETACIPRIRRLDGRILGRPLGGDSSLALEGRALHLEPIWRNRSDSVVVAELGEFGKPNQVEHLWARWVGQDEYEICCIPFFVYDLSLGDVVQARPDRGHGRLITGVRGRSGHVTFRLWFGESHADQEPSLQRLEEMGALLERSSVHLVAVDAPDDRIGVLVLRVLTSLQDAGTLMFEAGSQDWLQNLESAR